MRIIILLFVILHVNRGWLGRLLEYVHPEKQTGFISHRFSSQRGDEGCRTGVGHVALPDIRSLLCWHNVPFCQMFLSELCRIFGHDHGGHGGHDHSHGHGHSHGHDDDEGSDGDHDHDHDHDDDNNHDEEKGLMKQGRTARGRPRALGVRTLMRGIFACAMDVVST